MKIQKGYEALRRVFDAAVDQLSDEILEHEEDILDELQGGFTTAPIWNRTDRFRDLLILIDTMERAVRIKEHEEQQKRMQEEKKKIEAERKILQEHPSVGKFQTFIDLIAVDNYIEAGKILSDVFGWDGATSYRALEAYLKTRAKSAFEPVLDLFGNNKTQTVLALCQMFQIDEPTAHKAVKFLPCTQLEKLRNTSA